MSEGLSGASVPEKEVDAILLEKRRIDAILKIILMKILLVQRNIILSILNCSKGQDINGKLALLSQYGSIELTAKEIEFLEKKIVSFADNYGGTDRYLELDENFRHGLILNSIQGDLSNGYDDNPMAKVGMISILARIIMSGQMVEIEKRALKIQA